MTKPFQSLHHYYKSHWTDLPRRMTTICVGVPLLWRIFLDDSLRTLFFQGLHMVILWEWMQMNKSYSLWWSLVLLQLSRDLFVPALVSLVAVSQILLPTNTDRQGKQSPFLSGMLLITIPFYSWMRVQSLGFGYAVSLLLVTWNVDTGSLIAGRLSSGATKKQQPQWLTQVSPGKSIAGLVGGLVGGVGTYVTLGSFWKLIVYLNLASAESVKVNLELDTLQAIYIGTSLSVAASLGDLWESSLKRQWGVKDSSKLLPGHGGILDRFDSSLVAVLLYEYYIRHGMV
jgi:CDP-diglyceride synthetase